MTINQMVDKALNTPIAIPSTADLIVAITLGVVLSLFFVWGMMKLFKNS